MTDERSPLDPRPGGVLEVVTIDVGDGDPGWDLRLQGGDTIRIYAYVNHAGTVVLTADTDELAPERPLRINVNDGAVFSARPNAGDHDMHFVGDYAVELGRHLDE